MNDELAWYLYRHVFPAAFALLPARMDSPESRAELLAIGFQESQFEARVQKPKGPAHGFWQFERDGGVKEVLLNPHTHGIIAPICQLFCYDPMPNDVYDAIINNDILACIVARLRLWLDPRSMPPSSRADIGLKIYLDCWRPGEPRLGTWGTNFSAAWQIVKG